ncbi:DNA independent RNA polymerase I transcription factor [Yamadazyma tenuis]|nr:DNA independent RNA polymerase I transcription factor [Yamadazyma tenuis]
MNKKVREDDFNDKMYTIFVKTALEKLEHNRDTNQIESLTTKISLPRDNSESITTANFKVVLKNLISNVSKLDNESCNQLILSIIDYKWINVQDSEFKDIYSQFLLVLISSIPKYLFKVLNKICSEFKDVDNHSNHLHHSIMKNIVKYNPTILNKFPSVFQRNFPHYLASDSQLLSNYILNLVKALEYCGELQYDVWLLVIECCIKLDVELQNDLDDLDDEEIDELINGVEESDKGGNGENNSDDDSDSDADSDDEKDPEIDSGSDSEDENMGDEEYLINPMTTTKDIRLLVNRLDSIIHLLLKSASESFNAEQLNDGNGVYLFNTLSSLFRSHILPTHFTKSIQFLLFHITQYQMELSDSFLVLLIDITFNPSQILETRLKSMQYLSSYIARAKCLSKNQIVFVVSYLVGWLNKYIEEREFEINLSNSNDKSVGGMERFKLFYSTFQGLLYIFCFRYKLLQVEIKGDFEWEGEIDKFFQRVIITKFNPLKFIDETVCFIFANIATKLNVCYCYSIIEHNKRERMLHTSTDTKDNNLSLPASIGNFKQKQEFLDLEGYFPFDPLVLPLSKKLITSNYIEWSEVNPNQDEEDEDSASGSNHHTSSEEEDFEEENNNDGSSSSSDDNDTDEE